MRFDGSGPLYIRLFGFIAAGLLIAVALVASVGYRDTTAGQYVLGGIVAMGLAALIFLRPQFGAYILLITIFTNVSSIFTDQGLPSINKPLVLLVFVSLLANFLIAERGRLPRLSRVEWLALAYLGVLTASRFVAQDKALATENIVDLAKDLVIILCIVHSLREQDLWKRAAWLVILVAMVLATMGSFQIITGNLYQTFGGFAIVDQQEVVDGLVRPRLSGPVDAPNFWGQTLAAMIPLAIYRILDEKKLAGKIVGGFTVLVLVFAMMSTYSRGAFIAMIITLLLIAIERRARPSLIAVFALVSILLIAILPVGYAERIKSLLLLTGDGESAVYEESSFRGRSSEMKAGLMMFAEHPFLGVGTGNYNHHYQDYARRIGIETRNEARDPHSLYVQILAETGLAGIVTFGALFATLFASLRQVRQKLRAAGHLRWLTWVTAVQMSITSYLISSTFLHAHYIRYLWLLLALAIAAVHLSDSLLAETSHPSPGEVPA